MKMGKYGSFYTLSMVIAQFYISIILYIVCFTRLEHLNFMTEPRRFPETIDEKIEEGIRLKEEGNEFARFPFCFYHF